LNADKIDPEKCEYYAGKAEEVLPNVVRGFTGQHCKIVGIVDSPRKWAA